MEGNHCWSALTPAIEDDTLRRLVGTLTAGAVPVDHVCAELGPGCLEIATAPEDAVRSADSAALAKLYTKASFAGSGRKATFMAQLGSGFPGLGGHPSLSLHSTVDGTPLLCDEAGVLSKRGRRQSPGSSRCCLSSWRWSPRTPTPTVVSGRETGRPGPRRGGWATTAVRFGRFSNMSRHAWSCGSRVPIRVRTIASPCSSVLRSGASKNASTRPRPSSRLPTVVMPEVGPPFRRDLLDAADRFENSAAARTLFGPAFVEHYAAARRAEAAACHRFVSTEERERYVDYV